MPLDPTVLGRTYNLTDPYHVDRHKIREFATATGATHPTHHNLDAAHHHGHPDLVAPPTFPIVIVMATNQALLATLGVGHHQLIHSDQRFTHHRPIHAGDHLNCASIVDDITTRAGIQLLTTRADLTTTTGEPVSTAWTRLVVTPDPPTEPEN